MTKKVKLHFTKSLAYSIVHLLSVDKSERTTKVLLQLGLDGRTIISSAYPGFGFGRRNSVGH